MAFLRGMQLLFQQATQRVGQAADPDLITFQELNQIRDWLVETSQQGVLGENGDRIYNAFIHFGQTRISPSVEQVADFVNILLGFNVNIYRDSAGVLHCDAREDA
jgi:hypothetical protein